MCEEVIDLHMCWENTLFYHFQKDGIFTKFYLKEYYCEEKHPCITEFCQWL